VIDQRNILLAIVLSVVILVGWQFLFVKPQIEQQGQQMQQRAVGESVGEQPSVMESGGVASTPTLGANVPSVLRETQSGVLSREDALKKTARVEINSSRLWGSISLVGARIDDLVLSDYHETIDPASPNIVLLSPTDTLDPYYAEFGWLGANVKVPDGLTLWQADRNNLTPNTPVTLRWDNGEGLLFERRYALDKNFMLDIIQRVRNSGSTDVTLAPYGLVSRTNTPEILNFYILHEGLLGVFDGTLKEVDYDDVADAGTIRQATSGGWIGITDKYWLVALVPDQKTSVETSFTSGTRGDTTLYQADFLGAASTLPRGGTLEARSHLFAGAKEVTLLDKYRDELDITLFDRSVDFGWFYFLTKPIFLTIHWLSGKLGNFGLAILALTVGIRILLFPLANKSFRAMSKMKLLQPKLVELKERHGDDRQKLNMEMMQLYKAEGVNPMAGCLPVVVQIPVFFALYKVLFVTIEMRHAPFFGWISDLSARDPLGVFTAFGLINWNVPAALDVVNIGIWPIIMGVTMFFQTKLNPAPADPIQAKIFTFLPFIFTFILANFPAGLVIYWAWNNTLSILQQWVIMRQTAAQPRGAKSTSTKT
jgi:YidC/Oxa1 family membrane protein insertase